MPKKTSKKKRREELKKQLAQRTRESAETTYSTGRGIFKDGLTDVKFWRSNPNPHSIDIIPYQIGDWDPRIKAFNPRNTLKPGMWHYVLEVFVHRDVGGVEGQVYICMERTYGKPCPICTHRKQLQTQGADDDVIKALLPARYPRSIYNILCYDSAEEEAKGVQVWHTSHWLMQQYLIKLAKGPMRPGQTGVQPYVDFSSPYKDSGGRLISFEQEGTGTNTRYLAHQMIPRDYDIDEDYLDQTHTLDELLYIPKFGEVYEAYFGEPYDEDGDEEEDEILDTSADEIEDDEDEIEEDDNGEEDEGDEFDDMDRAELKKYNKSEELGIKILKKMTDDDIRDAIREAIGEEDELDEEEDEIEEDDDGLDDMSRAELKKHIKSEGLDIKVLKKMSDDDIREAIREAGDDESEEDEAGGDLECPGGGTLGKDIETLPECDDCAIWEECSDEAERLEKEKKKKKKKK